MSLLLRFALWGQERLRVCLMLCFRALPMRRNKAVFVSFGGRTYSDNPKAISEALRAAMPDADVVWLFFDPKGKSALLPEGVRAARSHSIRALFALSTARCWVDNMPKSNYIRKRPGQFYMQTWHGDRGFKKMLYDAPDHPAGKLLMEQRIADVLLSGSTFCEGTFHTGFDYHGAIARFGSPRNDLLIHPDAAVAQRARAALGLEPGDKVLLYAPTMRNAQRKHGKKQPIQQIDLLATLDALDARLGGPFRCVVRCHSTAFGLMGLPDDARIIDASSYEDMADLLLISDFLITDYSSSAGDFALTGRPIVLFQDDRAEFEVRERSFYFDIESSPYNVARTQAELLGHIQSLTPESARENCRAILNFYGAYEGGEAARRAAQLLIEQMR